MLYQKENSVGQNAFECIRYRDFFFVPHMHRHPELICVHEGSVTVETEGRREEIAQGEYALILSNRIHAYATPSHSVVDVCIFSEDYVPFFSKEVRGRIADRARFLCRPSVSDFARRELFIADRAPSFYLVKALLYAVLGEYRDQVVFSEAPIKNDALLDRIVGYVDRNYAENITMKTMAEALGYERHYLSRYFHSRIPIHFSQYVNWYRIDAATALLRNTQLPVTEVALRSGFQSIRSFNRVYLQFTGRTPSSVSGSGR